MPGETATCRESPTDIILYLVIGDVITVDGSWRQECLPVASRMSLRQRMLGDGRGRSKGSPAADAVRYLVPLRNEFKIDESVQVYRQEGSRKERSKERTERRWVAGQLLV
jgi:hypothetical protein